MARISTKELREKPTEELHTIMREQHDRLRDLRFRLAGAQLKRVHEIREARRTIAAIKTLLREQENNEQ